MYVTKYTFYFKFLLSNRFPKKLIFQIASLSWYIRKWFWHSVEHVLLYPSSSSYHVSNSKANTENRWENIGTRQVLIFRLAYRFVASFQLQINVRGAEEVLFFGISFCVGSIVACCLCFYAKIRFETVCCCSRTQVSKGIKYKSTIVCAKTKILRIRLHSKSLISFCNRLNFLIDFTFTSNHVS